MEGGRSMLCGVGLEQKFLAKAVAIACYLINRSPIKLGDEESLRSSESSEEEEP